MKVARKAPLSVEDSAQQTKGCRHSNPGICRNVDMANLCAFVRPDQICLQPPVSWPKQYQILKDSS